MAQVRIGKTVLGDGCFGIAVPVTGKNNNEIDEQVSTIVKYSPDIIEIRADYYDNLYEKHKLIGMLENVRKAANDIPVLFTVRTASEGGEVDISYDSYSEILDEVCLSGLVDAIDVQAFIDDNAPKLIARIKEIGVKVIASYHDFNKTPGQTELVTLLGKLIKTGADIAKVAVMPQKSKDVLNLLEATWATNERYPDTPIITMSMGSMGVISRISGDMFGSCLTFATVGKSSAPGQLEIEEIRSILSHL